MARWNLTQLISLWIYSAIATAQIGESGAAADQRKRLIEQKLRLVESLVNSPAARASAEAQETETSTLIQSGRKLLDQAHEALAANRLDEASGTLDEALRNATKASARLAGSRGALSTSVQQANYRNLSEQLASYRNGMEDLAKQGNNEAKVAAARITLLQSEAGKLADAGKLGDANRKLAEAYKLAVETISRLRAGQTVTLSLKFDTPAEEYDYERRRFQSSEILVDMMKGEGRSEGDRRQMVDGFVLEAKKLLDHAADQARSGDYKSAVTVMEKATAQLNRALQAMGVPVF